MCKYSLSKTVLLGPKDFQLKLGLPPTGKHCGTYVCSWSRSSLVTKWAADNRGWLVACQGLQRLSRAILAARCNGVDPRLIALHRWGLLAVDLCKDFDSYVSIGGLNSDLWLGKGMLGMACGARGVCSIASIRMQIILVKSGCWDPEGFTSLPFASPVGNGYVLWCSGKRCQTCSAIVNDLVMSGRRLAMKAILTIPCRPFSWKSLQSQVQGVNKV